MHIQTELGCKSLGELCYFSKDRVSATFANAYNYVSVDNLLPDKKGKTLASSVPDRGHLFQYQIGDILLGNIRPYLKKIWFADTTGATNGDVLVVRTRMGNSISPRFVYYVLSSDDFFAYNMQNTKGTKMPRGDKEAIMNYEFPVPPLEEQKRIASALSSVDELIASLDKQIAKTRDIKRGAMQRLFIGKTDAEHKTLGEVAHINKGIQFNKADMNTTGSYPVINGGTEASGYIEQYNCDKDTITVSQGGASAGYVNWLSQRFWAGAHCYLVKPNESTDNKYLYYFLKFNELAFMNSKYGGNIPALAVNTLLNFPIPIPPLAEQEHIADVLTSLDDTIEGLEAKRQKYEFVKAGMMQQLLTGSIRLD